MDLGIGGLGDGEEIASGASAVVYRAVQTELGRDVAVKVLTVSDPAFVRRFHREARTLGRLSRNPGIVTVYDSGLNDAGRPYLILELCRYSLLDRLHDGPIEPLEATEIMSEVAGAVADAHDLGVVHRDLKPANVLVAQSGRHLVTDFGIATITGGTTGFTDSVGFSAGYVAPETISGGVGGPAADVYSLGATMFHLVSGAAPFVDPAGESDLVALGTRVATEPVPDLRPLGVPDTVCSVIEQAMAKAPDLRPTAREMQRRLAAVIGIDEPSSGGGRAPLGGELHGPPAPASGAADAPTITVAPAASAVGSPGTSTAELDRPLVAGPTVGGPATGVLFSPAPSAAGPSTAVAPVPPVRRSAFAVPPVIPLAAVALLAFVLLTAVVVGGLLLRNGGGDGSIAAVDDESVEAPGTVPDRTIVNSQSGGFDPSGTPEVRSNLAGLTRRIAVPDVVGLTESAAEAALTADGLRVNIVFEQDTSVPVGRVFEQTPASGDDVFEGSLVTIFVAARRPTPPPPVVPDVAGRSPAGARSAIEALGLSVGAEPWLIYHDEVAVDAVVGTDPPAGTTVNAGSEVSLFVSLGKPIVPAVAGLSVAQVATALEMRTLRVVVASAPSTTVADGLAISADPSPGTEVETNAEITVTFSSGPPPCDPGAIGDLSGLTETAATAAVERVGCSIGPPLPPEPSGSVAAGLVLRWVTTGDVVRLVISSGPPADCQIPDLGGLTVVAATATVEAAGCTVDPVTVLEFSDLPEGLVIRGEVAGLTVRLIISDGPEVQPCTMPDVIGFGVAAARTAIAGAGCGGTVTVSPTGLADPIVVASNPAAGATHPGDGSVSLTVKERPPDVVVPTVVGMTQATAESTLTRAGLKSAVVTAEVAAGDPSIGTVVAQTPSAGTEVPPGSTVTITVAVEEPGATTTLGR